MYDHLLDVRRQIAGRLPEPARTWIATRAWPATLHTFKRWQLEFVNVLVESEAALLDARPADRFTPQRASCPLCGRGSSAPYAQGFQLPEGLDRHFGGRLNARQCPVIKEVFGLPWLLQREASATRADSPSTARRPHAEAHATSDAEYTLNNIGLARRT